MKQMTEGYRTVWTVQNELIVFYVDEIVGFPV